jgi:hypothetical protein
VVVRSIVIEWGRTAQLSRVLACLLGSAITINAAEAQAPAVSKVLYAGGQLTIYAPGSTLAAVLPSVAALTGVQIEVPEGAASDMMPSVQLGPGSPRQILASLLSDFHFDFLIQASDADSEKLQSVVIMPRTRKGAEGAEMDAEARPAHSPFVRTPPPPAESAEEATAPDSAASAQAENAAVKASAGNPQASGTQPLQSGEVPTLPQREATNMPRTAPLSSPPVMTSQSITQQLQQMYQQRMQMIQQEHQAPPPPVQQ